ncbi:urease [Aureococcus anophagefferens]|nr:urease [Aureococcus anophagefferens]
MTQRLIIEERRRSHMEYRESQARRRTSNVGGRASERVSGGVLPQRKSAKSIEQIKERWAELDRDDDDDDDAADPLAAVASSVVGGPPRAHGGRRKTSNAAAGRPSNARPSAVRSSAVRSSAAAAPGAPLAAVAGQAAVPPEPEDRDPAEDAPPGADAPEAPSEPTENDSALRGMEWFACTVFTAEIVARFAITNSARTLIRDPYMWFDILAVLPCWLIPTASLIPGGTALCGGLSHLKSLRMFRLLKLARKYEGSIVIVRAMKLSLPALTVAIFFFDDLRDGLRDVPLLHGKSEPRGRVPVHPPRDVVHDGHDDDRGLRRREPAHGRGQGRHDHGHALRRPLPRDALAIVGNNFCLVWEDKERVVFVEKLKSSSSSGAPAQDMRETFNMMDTDGSGSMSFREFRDAMRVLEINMSAERLAVLWRTLDADHSGEIDVSEFMELNDHVMLVRAFPRLGVNPGLGRRRCLHLTPREIDKLELHQVGLLAQKRLARGLKLNQPEATALIATVCLEKIRDGHSVAQLMTLGQRLLGRRQVLPGVAELVSEVQVEGTFRDGTKLLTVHDPIASDDGDLHLALHGSFLPLPDREIFGDAGSLVPGAVRCDGAPITLNAGRDVVEVRVTNTGDRPIQVGSHYHFLETNAALVFDRREAYGRRLNVPGVRALRAGRAQGCEPRRHRRGRVVTSGNLLTDGPATADREAEVMARVVARGFGHEEAGSAPGAPLALERAHYAELYGPTVGDVVRLGDTDLTVRVERDHRPTATSASSAAASPCEGMGQQTGCAAADALDVVITNALVVDAVLGVVKCDIGIKGNRIVGIGKAGNPASWAASRRA